MTVTRMPRVTALYMAEEGSGVSTRGQLRADVVRRAPGTVNRARRRQGDARFRDAPPCRSAPEPARHALVEAAVGADAKKLLDKCPRICFSRRVPSTRGARIARRRDVGWDRCRAGERMSRSGRRTGNTWGVARTSPWASSLAPAAGQCLAPVLALDTVRGTPMGSRKH